MLLQFYKYQGTGNDFVIIDNRTKIFDADNHQLVNRLCDRKFGIGADGLMLLENADNYDFKMVYFNADGKEGSMCGNGGRALVKFAHDIGVIADKAHFIAVDGEHEATVKDGIVSLKMGDVNEVEKGTDFYYLNTGSPHYVSFVDNVAGMNVFAEGQKIRYNERFKKIGTNVNFVEKIAEDEVQVRTYERGVEDETLSCGTGVTAAALTCALKGIESPVKIKTLGGSLQIAFEKKSENEFKNVYLIGPAEKVFSGTIEL